MVNKIDTGKYYAIKEIKKNKICNERDKANTIFERVILQNVKSPFIVKLHFAFQTPDKLYYVLDFCSGGELFFHLKKKRTFSEKKARFYAAECVLALEELHKNKIVYRDLKPENILLDAEGHVMLTDFGLSTIICKKQSKCYTFAGTPEYLAPEIIKEKGYTEEVDWWSLGAILYEMLAGVQPFHHSNQQRLLDNILFKDLRFPDGMSKHAKDLLTKLLDRNPTRRLGSGENGVQNIKNHKFFNWIDWEKLANRDIKPPFIPKINYESDSSNFDKQFTSMRAEDTEALPNRSIEEKQSTYIRDFTYYYPSGSNSTEGLDIEKVLEANLASFNGNIRSRVETIKEDLNEDLFSELG